MKEKRDVLKEVLKKYRFEEPLTGQNRRRIIISRKKTLRKILKIKGFSSVFVAAAVVIYMYFKKAGLTVSLSKCLMVVYSLIVTALIMLATGSVLIVKNYILEQNRPDSINELLIDEHQKEAKGDINQQEPDKKNTVDSIKFKLVMLPFTFDEKTSNAEKTIESTIFKELERLEGDNKIKRISSDSEDIHISKALLGSVIMLDNKYRITVRLLHRKSSRILSLDSETAKNKDDLERACRALAKKVADKI